MKWLVEVTYKTKWAYDRTYHVEFSLKGKSTRKFVLLILQISGPLYCIHSLVQIDGSINLFFCKSCVSNNRQFFTSKIISILNIGLVDTFVNLLHKMSPIQLQLHNYHHYSYSTVSHYTDKTVYTKLTLILLTWRIWWASNNASKCQMGFNSAFRWLKASFENYYTKYLKLWKHTVVPTYEIRKRTTQVLATLVVKTHNAVDVVGPCYTKQASWKCGNLTPDYCDGIETHQRIDTINLSPNVSQNKEQIRIHKWSVVYLVPHDGNRMLQTLYKSTLIEWIGSSNFSSLFNP